jgi:hypothetical protein
LPSKIMISCSSGNRIFLTPQYLDGRLSRDYPAGTSWLKDSLSRNRTSHVSPFAKWLLSFQRYRILQPCSLQKLDSGKLGTSRIHLKMKYLI